MGADATVPEPDAAAAALRRLANARMPFGRYQGRYLTDLPEEYLIWFARKGFPKGRLGDQMREALDLKTNGLESLMEPLRES